MTIEEKVLFEQNFHVIKTDINLDSDKLLRQVLRFLLCSKEITNTGLSVSDKETRGKLLSLKIMPINNDKNNCYISGIYYVTDGEITENRFYNGKIEFSLDEVILTMDISRITDCGVEVREISELFVLTGPFKVWERFSTYSKQDLKESDYVLALEEEAEAFIKDTLKLCKRP